MKVKRVLFEQLELFSKECRKTAQFSIFFRFLIKRSFKSLFLLEEEAKLQLEKRRGVSHLYFLMPKNIVRLHRKLEANDALVLNDAFC